MKNLNKAFLTRTLYTYGVITFLMILDHFEAIEEYKVCQMMTDVIDDHNSTSNHMLPTRIKDYLFEEVMFDYQKLGFFVSKEQIFNRQADFAKALIIDLTK